MKKDEVLQRRLEISSKFMEMGKSLLQEGDNIKDFCVKQSGSFFFILAGLIMNEDDTYEFSNMCSMFTAKKILNTMENTDSDMVKFLRGDVTNTNEDLKKRTRGKKGGEDTPKE